MTEVVQPKAYDIKKLAEKLKAHGIEATEEMAKKLVVELFTWLREAAALSDNPYDDMVVGVIKPLEKMLLDKAEAINPDDNLPPAA